MICTFFFSFKGECIEWNEKKAIPKKGLNHRKISYVKIDLYKMTLNVTFCHL